MTRERNVKQRIDDIAWYHEFDFGNGLRATSNTPDAEGHRKIWRFIETELDRIDFQNKNVLDTGCWDGFWSFYAERRGAKSVLATDDASQNWAQSSGLLLAKELFQSAVEVDLARSVYDLQSMGRQFDIILCLGVYYHLIDPAISGLRASLGERDGRVGAKSHLAALSAPHPHEQPRFGTRRADKAVSAISTPHAAGRP